jgi:hypothetical protein
VPKLVIFRGDAVENEIHVGRNTVRIGRHSRNDVVLDDGLNGVSRFHAEIRVDGSGYSIVDVNSRNGVWINGRRIKEKAALALGVPVTVGAFELALEDDVSSADFTDAPGGHTVVNRTATDRKDLAGRSGVRSKPPTSPQAATRRQVLLWSAAAAIVLLLCAVTFAVFRYRHQPATIVAIAEPAPPPVPVAEPEPAPQPPPEDPNAKLNEQDLAEARTQFADRKYLEALRDHLQPLLERDPENAEALELKKQVEQAQAAAQAQRVRTPPKVEPPTEVETPGIARKPGEAWTDYQARAKRVQTAFAEGKASLDKQDYAAALAHFRAVNADQPKYQNVDVLYAEVVRQQQKALEDAISNGQKGEQAGQLRLGRQWYLRALDIDPSSTSAREKHASILGRMNSEATKLFNAASFAQKSEDTTNAIQKFQQVVDLMMPGDEIRARAMKELEGLKR